MSGTMAVKVGRDQNTVLALFLSLSPLYFLVQARSRLGLDGLHISFLQIILVVALRWILQLDPRAKSSRVFPATEAPTQSQLSPPRGDIDVDGAKEKIKRLHSTPLRKTRARAAPATNPLYPPLLLDSTISNFLSVTSPAYTSLLPSPPSPSSPLPTPAALSTWNTLHSADDLIVSSHPTTPSLYAIAATFPTVPLRNLFATLTDISVRPTWDGMCTGTKALDSVEVGGRRGAAAWLGMKGMALIKPKDLCLLSMAGRLPTEEGQGYKLFCASTSMIHPDCPETKEFNRMHISISGFYAEEVGEGGSKVTQITDLSGLGSWIPSSVLKIVTQTMIPKSLHKLGKAAAEYDLTKSPFPHTGDDWLPPLVGSWNDSSSPSSSSSSETLINDDSLSESGSDLESDFSSPSSHLSPSSSRDLHELVSQIRTLTSRLTELEDVEQKGWKDLLLEKKNWGIISGSAVGAAVAVALVGAWGRRRKS